MSIVKNSPCPKCRDNGHDKTGNHLIHFDDGGMYCGKKHLHADGKAYYEKGDSDYLSQLADKDVSLETVYSVDEFKVISGKLTGESRAIVLANMKPKDRWEVCNEEEREAMLHERELAEMYFDQLKVKNLINRGIRGDICRTFNVRVGCDQDSGKVLQHYYPIYSLDGKWQGAKCRTLPKEFKYDHLGHCWGKTQLFGMQVSQESYKQGARKNKLLIVGGECDAMAAYQMLKDADKTGKYHYHVWSVVHGESALDDILHNSDSINQFDTILLGFDADAVGQQTNLQVSRLFRGKCKFLKYPAGCKDPNDCLLQDREAEFIDAWFNPSDMLESVGVAKSVAEMADKAKEPPVMGQQWQWKGLNKITVGIRENMLFVIGAGSGVGKTHFTKEVCFHVMEQYSERVGVIYLEEPPIKTLRSFAGRYIGKRIDVPANDPDDPDSHVPERDYTKEQADWAIDQLCDLGKLYIADTGGDKSIDAVMKVVDEFMAMGIKKIVIDNLTAITHPKAGSKVDALDETMKVIGTYKDENPCTIFLISHLKRVGGEGSSRVPHNHGGEVYESDFRGSGSITMWSNYCLAIERNTVAKTDEEKRLTTVRCLKDRDFGFYTGHCVYLKGDGMGKLTEISKAEADQIKGSKDSGNFDYGEY